MDERKYSKYTNFDILFGADLSEDSSDESFGEDDGGSPDQGMILAMFTFLMSILAMTRIRFMLRPAIPEHCGIEPRATCLGMSRFLQPICSQTKFVP